MSRVISSSFPSSRMALRSGRLVLCALTVVMAVLSGCSVQKRTTQRGWHVESSFGNKKPAPQAELMQLETPRVRWIHRPSSALRLPLITHQLPSTPLSRLLPEQETLNLCKDTVEHQDASNSAPTLPNTLCCPRVYRDPTRFLSSRSSAFVSESKRSSSSAGRLA